ncbi:MAG TPA: adenosyl-hopene transferase HpnH [Dongiaceae bacterium]|nr:adenosyl-hopene transferase HpnH [Dongiaceae bacterium]
MRYPLSLVLDSTSHLLLRKLRGDRKCPFMLSLEPLGGGCCSQNGSVLSVEQCVAALEECRAPIVIIGGREPLEYPDIASLTREILGRGKHVFLCTNGALIRQRLHMIPPYTNFFWNVRLDGTEHVHDMRLGVRGSYGEALGGIQAAKNAGFFVVVSSTVYPDTDIEDLGSLYEALHKEHVDGFMLTPDYPSQKLCRDGSTRFREKMHAQFREIDDRLGSYNLMTSPIYLEYLRGERELNCSAWASPVYGPKGWSEPCSKQNVRYAKGYNELLEKAVWENYGRGLDLRCENCLGHEGYETSAVLGVNPKVGDWWKLLVWQFSGNLGERRNGKH